MGFYLCLGILTTRKRVYKFLYVNSVGYFVLIMYNTSVACEKLHSRTTD